MLSSRHGALRAAALLRVLQGRRTPVRYAACRHALSDYGLDDLPAGERSIDQLRLRAVRDLRQSGIEIVDDGEGLSLSSHASDLTSSSRLSITAAQSRIRHLITMGLHLLEPDRRIDPQVLMKTHIPRDRVEFAYGDPGETIEGIPYHVSVGRRPWVFVRTDQGDNAFRADAMHSLRLLVPNAGCVEDGHPAPQKVESPRAVGSQWPVRRGRPTDVAKLREAQRIAVAVRSSCIPTNDGGAGVHIARLARELGVAVRSLVRIAELVQAIDDEIILDDDVFLVMPGTGNSTLLDGAQALLAYLEATAFCALGGGGRELAPELEGASIAAWLSFLDEFLDCADVKVIDEPVPYAANVVASILDHDILRVSIATRSTPVWADLRAVGMHWRNLRWWIDGALDGRPLAPEELPLSTVEAVDVQ